MVEDLGIECEDTEARISIDTDDIEAVRERMNGGETTICKETCIIYTKSGEYFLIKKPYYEMKLNLIKK